jgi:hypothetical protein
MSTISIVSLIRDTSNMMYVGVVMRQSSTFCAKDMKVTLNKKNRAGFIF